MIALLAYEYITTFQISNKHVTFTNQIMIQILDSEGGFRVQILGFAWVEDSPMTSQRSLPQMLSLDSAFWHLICNT
jgi:hypothetical protein